MIRTLLLALGLAAATLTLGCSGPEHKPPPPHQGPKAARAPIKGFTLRLGNGQSLRVNCGDEPMKGCIDAAKPLLKHLYKGNKAGPNSAQTGA